ncbi:hypothetical protein DFP72DRAFT_845134 [Ephemerocybe angulata]|uniref:Uncharacterized protein n=1 Tax=Ephemerocybe angulata TaxID=980116 RepID=A0A8H6I5C3_9AGAR|nr:hypothetical protein DFP72DRAFT_845134 [Tulosesus angulatus]
MDKGGLSILEQVVARSPPSAQKSVSHALFDALSPPDLGYLSCTSTTMSECVRSYREVAWDIVSFLSHWFIGAPDVYAFLDVLELAGAVVSGSQILRFLDRDRPLVDSDLDVITRIGGALRLIDFLGSIGYTGVEVKHEYPIDPSVFGISSTRSFAKGGGDQGILHVMDFVKPISRHDCTSCKVQVVVVAQHPVEHIIHTYHSRTVAHQGEQPAS